MNRRITDEKKVSRFSSVAYRMTVLYLVAATLTASGCGLLGDYGRGKYDEVEKMLKDATVLERARGQLAKAKESRRNLQTKAQQHRVDSEVAVRQIQRLEEEKAKSMNAFTTVQDAAKEAGLPRFVDATPEDKTKQIQVGSRTISGNEVYRLLQEYKSEIRRAESIGNWRKGGIPTSIWA